MSLAFDSTLRSSVTCHRAHATTQRESRTGITKALGEAEGVKDPREVISCFSIEEKVGYEAGFIV